MDTISVIQTTPTSLTLDSSVANRNFMDVFGDFIGQLLPENYPIIQEQLTKSPELRQQFRSILIKVAEMIDKYETVEDFVTAINQVVKKLSDALEKSEDSFYDTPAVKTARADLYALQNGFDNGNNKDLEIMVVDKNHWYKGTKGFSNRFQHLLIKRHKKFRGRSVPLIAATTWAMQSASAFKAMRDFCASIMVMVIDSLPFFPDDDSQLKYLKTNPVAGSSPAHPFGVVINSHANVGACMSRKDKTPLPVAIHLGMAQRIASGKVGVQVSGNRGCGVIVESDPFKQVVEYRRDEFDLRQDFKKHGVICLIKDDLRGRTTTMVGSSKKIFSDMCGMDAYLTVCHALFQLGVDLVDDNWTKDKEEALHERLRAYFESLFNRNIGERFLAAPVEKKHIRISRDPESGEVQITAEIKLPGIIDGVAFTVDPTIPNQQSDQDKK